MVSVEDDFVNAGGGFNSLAVPSVELSESAKQALNYFFSLHTPLMKLYPF